MAPARFALSRTMRTLAIFNIMNALIARHREAIVAVAASRHVCRLAIFGSAAVGPCDPARSDIDVLVEFEQLTPVDRADAYFGLLEDLELLFARPVDLLEDVAIRNPYLRRSVKTSRVVVYEAA